MKVRILRHQLVFWLIDIESESDESGEEEHTDWGPNNEKNSGLAVGHKGISIVLRGGQVGIFKETTDGKLELGGSVRKITGPGKAGKAFNPKKVSLVSFESN